MVNTILNMDIFLTQMYRFASEGLYFWVNYPFKSQIKG